MQGNGNAGKDNKLEQAVQIKSDSKDISVNKETKSSDVTKVDQKTVDKRVKSSTSKDNEVKKGGKLKKTAIKVLQQMN